MNIRRTVLKTMMLLRL